MFVPPLKSAEGADVTTHQVDKAIKRKAKCGRHGYSELLSKRAWLAMHKTVEHRSYHKGGGTDEGGVDGEGPRRWLGLREAQNQEALLHDTHNTTAQEIENCSQNQAQKKIEKMIKRRGPDRLTETRGPEVCDTTAR